jgi:hypothetical protein
VPQAAKKHRWTKPALKQLKTAEEIKVFGCKASDAERLQFEELFQKWSVMPRRQKYKQPR